MLRKLIQSYSQALRHKAFRRIWAGILVSRAGDAFTTVALSWLILEIAGPVQLGLVLMCFGLPRILSGPLVGWLLDRFDARLLLTGDNAVRGLLIAVIPVLIWMHCLAVADLYIIAVLSALLSSVTEVAEGALVPRLVDDADLEAANSLLSANWEVAYIAGPSLAGLLVAAAGPAWALLGDAASFAVMSVTCFGLPPLRTTPPAGTRARDASTVGRNWLGFGILLRFPAIALLSVCSLLVLTCGGMAEVLYPVYSRSFLHVSAAGYGALVSATGVGGLLGIAGAGLIRRLAPRWRIGAVLLGGAPFFGLLSVAPGLPVAFVLVFVASLVWGPYYVLERSISQRLMPPDLRARIVGARMALTGLGFPLGSAFAGFAVRAVSMRVVILAMTAGYLALGFLPLLSTALRRLDRQRTVSNLDAERSVHA